MIAISGLSKHFDGLQVLHDINLNVKDGEIYGLVGESGSGKSTLLRCINGLIPYDTGNLLVNDIEIKSLKNLELRKFRKNIGMIFQSFSLLERLNVYENIAFPMRVWKYNNAEIDKQVRKMLELVGLEDKAHSLPRELSGGQKQRVAIARSLLLNPKYLLSDESTSALDPKIGKSILSLLKDINNELGITIILVTHQMEAVRQTCDRMALLKSGKIVVDGKVKDVLLNNPDHLQALLGEKQKVIDKRKTAIRILIDGENGYNKFFSKFSKDTNVDFSYLSGGIKNFKEGEAFIGTIEVDKTATGITEEYFEKNNILFNLIDRGDK